MGSSEDIAQFPIPVRETVSISGQQTQGAEQHIPGCLPSSLTANKSHQTLFVLGLHTGCFQHGSFPHPFAR